MIDSTDADIAIRELTLLLAYLTSWREKPEPMSRAWKGYSFDVLDELQEQGLIEQSKAAKSLYITPEGETRAKELLAKYGIEADA